MVENFSDFVAKNSYKIVSVISDKLKKINDKQGLIDKEISDDFFSLYNIAKMTATDV